jgi:hypothetical protein
MTGGKPSAVDDRDRDLESHALALGEGGVGDGLRHPKRDVFLADDALCTGRRRQNGGNGGTRKTLGNRRHKATSRHMAELEQLLQEHTPHAPAYSLRTENSEGAYFLSL